MQRFNVSVTQTPTRSPQPSHWQASRAAPATAGSPGGGAEGAPGPRKAALPARPPSAGAPFRSDPAAENRRGPGGTQQPGRVGEGRGQRGASRRPAAPRRSAVTVGTRAPAGPHLPGRVGRGLGAGLGPERGRPSSAGSGVAGGGGLHPAPPAPLPLPPPPGPGALAGGPGRAAAEPGPTLEQTHQLVVLVVQHAGQEQRGLLRATCLEAPARPALAVHGHVPQSLGAGLALGPRPAGRRAVQPRGVGVIAQLVDPFHELTLGAVALLQGARRLGQPREAPRSRPAARASRPPPPLLGGAPLPSLLPPGHPSDPLPRLGCARAPSGSAALSFGVQREGLLVSATVS